MEIVQSNFPGLVLHVQIQTDLVFVMIFCGHRTDLGNSGQYDCMFGEKADKKIKSTHTAKKEGMIC